MQAKQREHKLIKMLYRIEKVVFYIYAGYGVLLLLVLLLGLLLMRTAVGAFILSGAIPWLWILPLSLLFAFIFPLADTFIQDSEERWFRRYGTTINAAVTGYDAINGFNWRIFPREIVEYRVHLTWRKPDSEQSYAYVLRVREQRLPREGTPLSVVIDYDDPTYYLKKDITDPSLLF